MIHRRAVAGALAGIAAVCLCQAGWIHAKAALAQVLLERAWQESAGGPAGVRPWPWADTWPVGRLRVAELGVDWIVLSGAGGRTLAFAPGHLSGSAPLGAPGHTVLAGHRDTHFAFLRDIQIGTRIEVSGPDGRAQSYRVVERGVVHERDANAVDPWAPSGLTLLTCYPFDTPVPGGPLRWIVVAEPEEDYAEPSAPALRSAATSSSATPTSRSTSSVCCPSDGAGDRRSDGVSSKRSAGRGMRIFPTTG